ncbi:MAG: right-handed parallel beta-helix repeat-containing protein, partial [Thermoplasmata archaeon]|nr:right-handed parallel beta-helix repeat-containing protein [Thermoplasmata archaeon]
PGDYVRTWQDDDPAWNYKDSDGWANHNEGQILKIKNIIGSRLYVDQEIRAAYYSKFNPESQKLSLSENIGLDNLIIERADKTTPIDGITINFNLVSNSWIRGCELINCFRAHIVLQECTKIEITSNYIHDAYEFGGNGRAYGTLLQSRTGDCLIQNNIFSTLRHAMVFQAGANGNVLGYNYSRNAKRTEFPSDFASDITFHGNRPYANLAEGNIVCAIQIDNSHGQGAGLYNTIFRNAATTCGLMVMSTSPKSDNQNIVGNDVLWTSFIGNYSITGSNHFIYGNRYQKSSSYTLSPVNTSKLSDYSYYLNKSPLTPIKPAWWTLSTSIPTIGIPTTWKSFTNPAKARWDSNGVKTVGTTEPLLLLKK